MNEIEIIARAQMYLEKLANGVNPLTDEEVAENDVVNNVRISRCLYYVTGILKQITTTGSFEIQKSEFSLSAQQLERFAYSQTPLTVSEITKRLNELVNPLQCSTLKNGVITEWLTEIGMLTNVIINNKSKKRVTDNGRSVGIISEQRVNHREARMKLFHIRQPLKIQFLFLNIILNSKSEKTYRNITFYIIIHIVFT